MTDLAQVLCQKLKSAEQYGFNVLFSCYFHKNKSFFTVFLILNRFPSRTAYPLRYCSTDSKSSIYHWCDYAIIFTLSVGPTLQDQLISTYIGKNYFCNKILHKCISQTGLLPPIRSDENCRVLFKMVRWSKKKKITNAKNVEA